MMLRIVFAALVLLSASLFVESADALVELKALANYSFESSSSKDLYDVQAQANAGSVEAFYILGLYYLYSPEMEKAALDLFEMAAKEGHNNARCAAGLIFHHGHGSIRADNSRAEQYFRLASNADHVYGKFLLGRSLLASSAVLITSHRNSTAVAESNEKLLAEAAALFALIDDDIPEAAHHLAVMYEYGPFQENDTDEPRINYRRAAELYEKASRRGFVQSTYHLALMYVYGRGVPRDYVVAADLFRKAALNEQQPHAPSMRYLAIIYANEYSHPSSVPDYDEALRWYEACGAAEEEYFRDVRETCIVERNALSDAIEAARARSQR